MAKGGGQQAEQLVAYIEKNDAAKLREEVQKIGDGLKQATYQLPPNSFNGIQATLPSQNLTLMHIAAFYDALECFLVLAEKGLTLNVQSPEGYEPLHYACVNKSKEVALHILEKDPSRALSLPGNCQHHLIYLTVTAGDHQILKALIDRGADVDAQVTTKDQPLRIAIFRKFTECVVLLLENTKTDVDKMEPTPLMMAVQFQDQDFVRMFFERGWTGNIHWVNPDGKSALYLACDHGLAWKAIIQMLLQQMDPLKIDAEAGKQVKGAVHWAFESANKEIIQMVVETIPNVDVNRLDERGRPPPYYGIDRTKELPAQDFIECLEILKNHGYKFGGPDSSNAAFVSELLIAMEEDKTYQCQIMDYMLQNGLTPRDEATIGGQKMTVAQACLNRLKQEQLLKRCPEPYEQLINKYGMRAIAEASPAPTKK